MNYGKKFEDSFPKQGNEFHLKSSLAPFHCVFLAAMIFISSAVGSAFTPLKSGLSTQNITEKSLMNTQPTSTPIPQSNDNTSMISTVDPVKALPEVKSDLDFVSYRYHSWDIPGETSAGSGFWLEVDLTNQMLYAYQDDQLISGFKVSTGTEGNETATGTFKIFSKYPSIKMTGPGYDLPHVPYSMFFYKGFAIHGTYWHHNFGTPMSHGCVNMNTPDAAWIYANAPVGTYVMVHY
jgi:hypothetical protein